MKTEQIKYIFWSVLSVCSVFIVYFVYKFFSSPKDEPSLIPIQVAKAFQDKVDKAQENALVEKVKATVQAENAHQTLNDILIIDDGAERRKKLAELLSKSQ